MVKTIAMIALGGACGSVIRHLMNGGISVLLKTDFPAGILFINVLGSFFMGMLFAAFTFLWSPVDDVRMFLTAGVLGGFTTFSAFSLDAMQLWSRGDAAGAMLYVILSIGFSIAAVFAGSFLVMRCSS